MSKVRINDLARELEVKSRPILDALEAIGITGKTHSSSIEEDQAEKVRAYFSGGGRASSAAKPSVEAKPRFDLKNVSKPGDALKAILERKQAEATARATPPPRPQAVVAAPSAVPHPQLHHCRQPAPQSPIAAASAPAHHGPGSPRAAPHRPAAPAGSEHRHPSPAPAIASRPPAGPVIARPPVTAAGTTPVVARPVAAPPRPATTPSSSRNPRPPQPPRQHRQPARGAARAR